MGRSGEPDDARRRRPADGLSGVQDAFRDGPGAAAGYTLVGAILFLGAVGYGIDRWCGIAPWGLFGGLLLGIIVGFYGVIKATWPRR